MDVTITIPPEILPKVQHKANLRGRDVSDYIQELVEKDASTPSLDEILAPIREQFAASGITEEELDQLFEEERQAVWEERHGKKS